ncbi:MAG: hypothetical protein ACE145_07880 [Terriglobia bacterium]
MTTRIPPITSPVRPLRGRHVGTAVVLALLIAGLPGILHAQKDSGEIDDITGRYEFLNAGDTLALLDEEGKLKGYIDVLQGDEESDAVLSYSITIGSRKKKNVEFKTAKIHQKYFRFIGTVERGSGHEEPDPDFLRLVGDLEIVTIKGENGEEFSQRMHVVFKSKGRESEEEQ